MVERVFRALSSNGRALNRLIKREIATAVSDARFQAGLSPGQRFSGNVYKARRGIGVEIRRADSGRGRNDRRTNEPKKQGLSGFLGIGRRK